MLTLSEDTEILAYRLAVVQKLSVDDTVRRALEQQAQSAALESVLEGGRVSDLEVARRRAAMEDITRRFDALPDLDPKSPKEIMDEINQI